LLKYVIPFTPVPLQNLLHYYGMIRPRLQHRYFQPYVIRLWLFLLSFATWFSRSAKEPAYNSCHLYTAYQMGGKQVSPILVPAVHNSHWFWYDFINPDDASSMIHSHSALIYSSSSLCWFFRIAHHPCLASEAAFGDLQPTPVCRLREAYSHLFDSYEHSFHILATQYVAASSW